MEMNMLEKIDNFGTLEKDEVAEFRLDVELMMELNQKMRDYLREITGVQMKLMDVSCALKDTFDDYSRTASLFIDKSELTFEDIETFEENGHEIYDSIYDSNEQMSILDGLIYEINYQIDNYDEEKEYRQIEEQMQGMN